MIVCTVCKVEKDNLQFDYGTGRTQRNAACRDCTADRVKRYRVDKAIENMKLSNEIMKEILKEIILACDCKNGKRLRLCVEKAKIEVGGSYNIKGAKIK